MPEINQALGTPTAGEEMEKVHIQGLISHRVVAIRRGQPYPGGRAGGVLLSLVVEEKSGIQGGLVAEHGRALANKFVEIVDFQNRIQTLRLKTQTLFDLIDTGGAGAEASGGVDTMKDKRRIDG